MPRMLSWRIGLALAFLAIATWISIGATLFVVLRGLHADATAATLNNVARPLEAQARQRLTGVADVRAVMGDLRDQVEASGYSLYIVTGEGRLVTVDGDRAPIDAVRLPAAAGRGTTVGGTTRSGGIAYAWIAIVLRPAGTVGPRALVLTMPDISAGDALRDLIAAFPAVVVVTLLVGVPISWLIARSVTRPLRRLAAAAGDLPTGQRPPVLLPLDGPTEVRDLTQRFNAMATELSRTRREEADLLANLRHDLRTPVTVISGFAAALTDGTASGVDIGRAARAIEEEANRLAELVGQLGAVERLESGEASLRPETIDAAALLLQTAERFRAGARAQGTDIVAMAPPPGLTLMADRLAVDRIRNHQPVLPRRAPNVDRLLP